MSRRAIVSASRAELEAVVAAGISLVDAAKEYGVSYQTMRNTALRAGIHFAHGNRRGPVGRDMTMKVLYEAGYTLEQIGEQFGVTRERVRQVLSKHFGMSRESGGQSAKASRLRQELMMRKEARCMKKYGCSVAQYRELRAIGLEIMEKGIARERTPLGAFLRHRMRARWRKISFEMTLWQWWTVWQQSGRWAQRGRGQGYVMCRRGDEGPYAIDNVFIAPACENTSITKRKMSNLPIGVSKHRNGFLARRMIDRRVLSLGVYRTPELAHAAYLSASIRCTAPSRDAAIGVGSVGKSAADATQSSEAL